jgi:hypothetical protein
MMQIDHVLPLFENVRFAGIDHKLVRYAELTQCAGEVATLAGWHPVIPFSVNDEDGGGHPVSVGTLS